MPPVIVCSLVTPGFVIPCVPIHYENSSDSSSSLNSFRVKRQEYICSFMSVSYFLVGSQTRQIIWEEVLCKIHLGYFNRETGQVLILLEESPSLFDLCFCFSSINFPPSGGCLWSTNGHIQKTRKKKHRAGDGA